MVFSCFLGLLKYVLLLFADAIILMSNTIVGLQNQLDNLKGEADRLYLTINLEKTNVMVFRKGGYVAVREKWMYGNEVVTLSNQFLV